MAHYNSSALSPYYNNIRHKEGANIRWPFNLPGHPATFVHHFDTYSNPSCCPRKKKQTNKKVWSPLTRLPECDDLPKRAAKSQFLPVDVMIGVLRLCETCSLTCVSFLISREASCVTQKAPSQHPPRDLRSSLCKIGHWFARLYGWGVDIQKDDEWEVNEAL